jgi:SAM-dependent methyltransferase
MSNASHRACPNCAKKQATKLPVYSRDEWNVVSCDNCEMIYLQNPPAYEAFEEDFAWEKTYAAEHEKRAKKRGPLKRTANALRVLNYRLRPDETTRYLRVLGAGKILDVGCGDVVRWKAPFVPFGIEISKVLAKRADDKMRPLGGTCRQGAGATTIWEFPEDHFDSIMMHSYLEHEVDVDQILRGALRCLKPGGKAFIRVPNFNSLNRKWSKGDWPGMRHPDHVNYFTVETLKSVATNAGLDFQLKNKHKIWLDDNIQALFIKPIQN